MNNEVRSTIVSHLEGMMADGTIKPEGVIGLTKFLDEIIDGINKDTIEILSKKIRDWEETMGDDDKSLYTLGLRQAVDTLRGLFPKHAREYKPLDEEDFRS
jgi:hypothetical protein